MALSLQIWYIVRFDNEMIWMSDIITEKTALGVSENPYDLNLVYCSQPFRTWAVPKSIFDNNESCIFHDS